MANPTPQTAPGAARVNDLITRGANALNAGDITTAEPLLREAHQLDPTNPAAFHNLAVVLCRLNRAKEAEAILIPAVQRSAPAITIALLGEIFETTGRPQPALQCYETVLKVTPRDYGVLMKAAALKDQSGDKAGAIDCYRRATEAQPDDFDAVMRYGDLICTTEPETALRLYEALLAKHGGELNARAAILQKLVSQKEWTERIRRGEMPWHCARVDELLFNYAAEYAVDLEKANAARVAAKPKDPNARVALGTARFCLKDRRGAEEQFRAAGDAIKGRVLDVVNFAPEFYDRLRGFSDVDLIRGLPPLEAITPPAPDAKGTLYLSCNYSYFRAFALPMVVSLRDRSPHIPVHLHIMDATPQETKFAHAFMQQLSPMKFALSVERPGLQNGSQMVARSYYHAVRFIRFYQHLRVYRAPLWLMDVDAVVNRDLTDLFGELDGHDAAMRIRPARLEPWNQFNACVVGASTTPASMTYFKLVAAYLAHYFQQNNLQWGIDQLAMYGVFADMQDHHEAPSLALLGEREVDYDYRADGFIWCNSGIGKFAHLQRIQTGKALSPEDFVGNKFVGVFENYWNETERIAARVGVTNG